MPVNNENFSLVDNSFKLIYPNETSDYITKNNSDRFQVILFLNS